MARFYKLPDGTRVPAAEYEGEPEPETPDDETEENEDDS